MLNESLPEELSVMALATIAPDSDFPEIYSLRSLLPYFITGKIPALRCAAIEKFMPESAECLPNSYAILAIVYVFIPEKENSPVKYRNDSELRSESKSENRFSCCACCTAARSISKDSFCITY